MDSENLAVADIETILARWEPARAVAVYPVPDPVAGDQQMAAVEPRTPLPDPARVAASGGSAAVAPAALGDSPADFLAVQPDLGTKMPPRFVRLVRTMRVTATRKTARSELRAQRWHTEDPVLWRPYGPGAAVHGSRPVHRRLTSKDRERLRTLFAEHGRADLVRPAAADPAAPQSGRSWA